MSFRLIGTEPYQVPTNADLGTMAFQDSKGASIEQANIAYLYVNGGDATNVLALDDISYLFDGVTQTFTLTIDNFAITPVAPEQMLINVGGIMVQPFINTIDKVFLFDLDSIGFTKGYRVNSDGTITFSFAPLPGMDFDARMLNNSQTYATNRTYPFKPLSIAFSDY